MKKQEFSDTWYKVQVSKIYFDSKSDKNSKNVKYKIEKILMLMLKDIHPYGGLHSWLWRSLALKVTVNTGGGPCFSVEKLAVWAKFIFHNVN